MDEKGVEGCFCKLSDSFSGTSTDSSLGRMGEAVEGDGKAEAGRTECGTGDDG